MRQDPGAAGGLELLHQRRPASTESDRRRRSQFNDSKHPRPLALFGLSQPLLRPIQRVETPHEQPPVVDQLDDVLDGQLAQPRRGCHYCKTSTPPCHWPPPTEIGLEPTSG